MEDSRLIAMLFAGLLVGFLLVFLIAYIRWIARDARSRGKSPLPVVLLAFISFPLGLLLWLVFRPDPVQPASRPLCLEDHRVQ